MDWNLNNWRLNVNSFQSNKYKDTNILMQFRQSFSDWLKSEMCPSHPTHTHRLCLTHQHTQNLDMHLQALVAFYFFPCVSWQHGISTGSNTLRCFDLWSSKLPLDDEKCECTAEQPHSDLRSLKLKKKGFIISVGLLLATGTWCVHTHRYKPTHVAPWS